MQKVMDEFHESIVLERNASICGELTSETNALFSIERISSGIKDLG